MQRLTGLGFAMVASPLLILVLGPRQGVLLANILTFALSVLMIPKNWHGAQRARLMMLIPTSFLAALFGSLVIRYIPTAWLLTGSGALVLGALLLVVTAKNIVFFKGHVGAAAAGLASGFMNVTAGVGGPAITLYAVSSAWEQRSFYASMPIYLAVLNLASFITKGELHLSWLILLIIALAVVAGMWIGRYLSIIVPQLLARKLIIFMALMGASATLLKGIFQLCS